MKPNPVTSESIVIDLDDHSRLTDVGRKVSYVGLNHNRKQKTLAIICEVSHYKKSSNTDITGDVPNITRTLLASDRNYVSLPSFVDYTPAIDVNTGLPIIPNNVVSEYSYWMSILEDDPALIFDKIYDAIALRASQGLFDN